MATRTRFESAADRPVFSITQICYPESRLTSPGNHGEPTARPANTARGLGDKECPATVEFPASMARPAWARTALAATRAPGPTRCTPKTAPKLSQPHLPGLS